MPRHDQARSGNGWASFRPSDRGADEIRPMPLIIGQVTAARTGEVSIPLER